MIKYNTNVIKKDFIKFHSERVRMILLSEDINYWRK